MKTLTNHDLLLIAANYLMHLGIEPLTASVHGDIRIHLRRMPLDQFTELADTLENASFVAFASSEYVQVHLTGEHRGAGVTLLVALDRGPCLAAMPELGDTHANATLPVTAEQVQAFAPVSVPA